MADAIAPRGISLDHMKLLTNFANTIEARQYEKQVTVTKMVLSFDTVNGFSIELEETPNTPPAAP